MLKGCFRGLRGFQEHSRGIIGFYKRCRGVPRVFRSIAVVFKEFQLRELEGVKEMFGDIPGDFREFQERFRGVSRDHERF